MSSKKGNYRSTFTTARNVFNNAGFAYKLGRALYSRFSGPQAKAATASYSFKKPLFKRRFKRSATNFAIKKKCDKLCNQVKELKKQNKASRGTQISRFRTTDRIIPGVNLAASNEFVVNDSTNMELVLSTLKYYNPSVPGTLTTAAGATGTYSKSFLFKSIYGKCTVRNNYQVPASVAIYLFKVVEDTSVSPKTNLDNALANLPSAPLLTNPLIYPSDVVDMMPLWKIEKTAKKVLQPGSLMEMSHAIKNVMYDPSVFDSHNLTYQTEWKSFVFLVRVQGVLAHDTTLDEQGISGAGVDVKIDSTYIVDYEAGADIKDIVITNNASSFTNGAQLSNKPASSQQAYSL